MKKKKLMTLAIATALVITCVPTNMKAATFASSQEANGNQETQKALEKVILKVKERVSIPKECTEFNYDYYTYNYGQGDWYLRWNSTKGSRIITVNCDNNGNITHYRDNRYDKEKKVQLKFLKSELESTAMKYLNQVYPSLKNHFQLVASGYDGIYQNSYTYKFERVENNIAMPDNTLAISVSAEDKSLVAISSNIIFNVKIPDAKKEINEEKAIALLEKSLTMSLGYYNKVETLADGSEQIKAYLAYTPNTSYVAVDAKTGEIYTTRSEWRYTSAEETASQAYDKSTGAYDNGLTDEEISKIEEMSDLLSKEEAIGKIIGNKYLLLDNSAKEVTAKLTQQSIYLSAKEGTKTNYYWDISFEDPREPDYQNHDYYRAYAYARVDAETGELISFSASVKSADYDKSTDLSKYKALYSEEKCQKIFEKFLSDVNGERFQQTKFAGVTDSYVLAYTDTTKLMGGLGYRYDRHNEDIPYSYNSIHGDVDRVTGKVYSYGYHWDDNVIFESKRGAISAKEAYDAFMKLDGFDVVYEYNTINTYNTDYLEKQDYYYNEDAYSVDFEVRLVYSIQGITPKMISPFSKKQLDWNGEEVNPTTASITAYTDIKDSKYERSIQLLSDIGLGYTSRKFQPNKGITVDDLLRFSQAAGFYFEEDLRKEVFTNYYVSRQTFAKFACYLMDLEEIATLPGIFATGYADETSIHKEYLGYVAIAKGFSLMKADDKGNFNPNQQITRGEAADILIKLVQK